MAISKILTDSAVKAAKPKEKPYKLSDTGRLYLLVSTAGSKYWKWNYRLDGKDCTYTLGEYPDVGLQKARELRDAARRIVAEGIHPADYKKERIRQRKLEAATTFWGVTEEWINFKKPLWTPSYLKQVENFMGRYIRDGELGSLPIGKITSADIVSLVRGVARRTVKVGEERKSGGAPTVAINLRQWCSAVFRFAIVSGQLAVNPIGEIQLKDVVTRPRVKNNRPLNPEEISDLLKVLKEYKFGTRSVRIAVELLLLTFVRTGELRMATWDEFDLKTGLWTIPAVRMKVKDTGDHVVPLSRQVIALLRELLQMRGMHLTKPKPDWVFPNFRRPEACMSATTINRALERMGFNGRDSIGFAAHGFRGTASTLLNEQGLRHKVIEFQLAHKEKNRVAGAYNKAEYLEERVTMMQRWADYIDTLRPAA
jgi:integrase